MTNKVDKWFIGVFIIVLLSSTLWHINQNFRAPSAQDSVEKPLPESLQKQADIVEKSPESATPDFASIMDVREKKTVFFAFIKELVDIENQRLYDLRLQLLSLEGKTSLVPSEEQWLAGLAKRYRVDKALTTPNEHLNALLLKIDTIPVSLALVQAANESAWGTSRFALNANNFFGQWCFSPGCGLVPERRPDGASYEVQKFASPAHSVQSYMHNLNASHHYEGLREMRMKRRQLGEPVTGPALAHGLYAYSIRGVEYVDELVKMIEGNDLLRYDLEQASE